MKIIWPLLCISVIDNIILALGLSGSCSKTGIQSLFCDCPVDDYLLPGNPAILSYCEASRAPLQYSSLMDIPAAASLE